jgi:hypothetical protein
MGIESTRTISPKLAIDVWRKRIERIVINDIRSCKVEEFYTNIPKEFDFEDMVYEIALEFMNEEDEIEKIINIMKKYAYDFFMRKIRLIKKSLEL